MRRVASALFLALTAALAGCSAYRSYTYSSPEGKTCLNKCEDAMWACKARCGKDVVCVEDCEKAAKTCRKSCPEISIVEPNDPY